MLLPRLAIVATLVGGCFLIPPVLDASFPPEAAHAVAVVLGLAWGFSLTRLFLLTFDRYRA